MGSLYCSVEEDIRRCRHDILQHLGLPAKKRCSVSIFSMEIITYSQGLFKSVPAIWHVQHVLCFRRLLQEKHFPSSGQGRSPVSKRMFIYFNSSGCVLPCD